MEGKLIDLSPNSRLLLVYQNAILVNGSVILKEEMANLFYSCVLCLYQVLRK
ncbi:hypothetical protein L9Z41_18945 [Leptospira noguchii]|uniref:hypothetical protein n=1 Tax=Leptospira noguchii TaxID=28182 RepID=UPI001F059EC4|nr:hypothetical protein [Leptospira noguchii]MCH1913893.1 hypothetical protein [Leptospira noguchii]MCH1917645.1 hypothetical protein [Leptospira noguchii]UOG65947.1 hypothetical protein MAL04_19220 [Leptospira noguchii]